MEINSIIEEIPLIVLKLAGAIIIFVAFILMLKFYGWSVV